MRVVFMGTPQFAVSPLQGLLESHHEVVLVVTQPPRPAGRRRRLTEPPVAQVARTMGVQVHQPVNFRTPESIEPVRTAAPDVIVVAAFGLLVPRAVLDIPPLGCLNIHPSLLPQYRGASPIQAALLHGDSQTGITIFLMEETLDTGPILAQQSIPINDEDDALSLRDKLSHLGRDLVLTTLDLWSKGQIIPIPQDHSHATYAPRIRRQEAEIDWHSPALTIWRMVRAYRGWPDAYTWWDGRLLKVLRARVHPQVSQAPECGRVLAYGVDRRRIPVVETANGGLELVEVMLEGRRATSGEDFLRGHPRLEGAVLGRAHPITES